MKTNNLRMRSKFAFWCGLYERSNFAWSKKAFVFTDFAGISCSGTLLIPLVLKQKLDFVEPYLRAIQD